MLLCLDKVFSVKGTKFYTNILWGSDIGENLYIAYQALLKQGIVEERELAICQAWLDDIR